MQNSQLPALIVVALLAGTIAGCSGNAPELASFPEFTRSVSEAPIVGAPTEVYERIARGALSCWFGAAGPLKADYVYHAEAAPASQGGKAEIVIHERDRLSGNPRGIRAYRIGIAAEKERTTLVFENFKMPENQARSMEVDARRWGAGSIGCAESQSGGWSENTPTPPSPTQEAKKKRSSKSE